MTIRKNIHPLTEEQKQMKEDGFDERDLASGNLDLLEKSDAELFPDETEEYTEEERKPKVVVNNKPKKK